jgi:hypothetical protein
VTDAQLLADADALASHLWRVPPDEQPEYKRAINRLLSLITGALVTGALFVSSLHAQTRTIQGRDSSVADTLSRMRPYLSTGRDRNKADSLARLLRTPMAARVDTVRIARVDTVTVTVRDTVRIVRVDTVYVQTPPPPPPIDTTVVEKPPPPPPPTDTARFDGPAEMPRYSVDLTYPPGLRRTLRVNTASPTAVPIQLAIDTARAGDDVVIPAGSYIANLTLRGCSPGWIVIRGEGLNIPVGTRMTPTRAATVPKLGTIVPSPVIRAEDGACGYRIVGLEIGAAPTLTLTYSLVTFGDGDEATLGAVPRRLIVDRSYVHGHASLDARRGVYLNCGECGVVDSWVSEIHSTFDAAAVWAINGTGPIALERNYLEASGENVMVGGGHLRIANVQPSDITIRRNHIAKPLAWVGTKWQLKNLLEFKTCVRCLIEENVFENNTSSTQGLGYAIVWTATDQSFGTPWATVSDVVFRWNEVRNVNGGFNLLGWLNPTTGSFAVARVTVRDNLLGALVTGKVGAQMQRGVSSVTFARNTFAGADYGVVLTGDAAVTGFAWRDNLLSAWTEIHYTNPPATSAPGMVSSGTVRVAPGAVLPASPGVDRTALAQKLAGVVVAP